MARLDVQEGWTRVGARVLMLPLPGMTDHFPGDYERALREAIHLEGYLDRELDPQEAPLFGSPEDLATADVAEVPLRYRIMIAFRKAIWDRRAAHSQLQGPPAVRSLTAEDLRAPATVPHPTDPTSPAPAANGAGPSDGHPTENGHMYTNGHTAANGHTSLPQGPRLEPNEPAYDWCSEDRHPAANGHTSLPQGPPLEPDEPAFNWCSEDGHAIGVEPGSIRDNPAPDSGPSLSVDVKKLVQHVKQASSV